MLHIAPSTPSFEPTITKSSAEYTGRVPELNLNVLSKLPFTNKSTESEV